MVEEDGEYSSENLFLHQEDLILEGNWKIQATFLLDNFCDLWIDFLYLGFHLNILIYVMERKSIAMCIEQLGHLF